MRRLVSAGIALSALTLVLASTQTAHAQFLEQFNTLGAVTTGTTGYSLVNNGVFTAAGQYRVVNNASTSFTNGYLPLTDQSGNGGGILFFDGAGSATTPIYNTGSIALVAGTAYTFSFVGASGSAGSPPTLTASFTNPASVTTALTGTLVTTPTGTFTQYSSTFLAVTGGNYSLSIFDSNTAVSGNDGAIDNVRLVNSSAPEPGSLALLLPVMGTVGMVLRRRRK